MRYIIFSALFFSLFGNAVAQVEDVMQICDELIRSHHKDMSSAIKLSKQETVPLLECSIAHEFFVRLNGHLSPRNVVIAHSMAAQKFLRAAYVSSHYENGKPLLTPTTFGILLHDKSKNDFDMRNAINAKLEECAILEDISEITRENASEESHK